MIGLIILIAIILGILSFAAWGCGDFPPVRPFIRRTFIPLTKHEFWFPDCGLCWAIRIITLFTIAAVVWNFIP